MALVALAAFVLAPACRSTPEEPGDGSARRRGSMAELNRMLREGARGGVDAEVVEREEPVETALGEDQASTLPTTALGGVAGAPQELSPPAGSEPGSLTADPQALEQGLGALGDSAIAAPLPAPGNPYLLFGERIIPRPDGRITKPYPLPVGRGRKLLHMLALFGGFPLQFTVVGADAPPAPDQVAAISGTSGDPSSVQVVLLEKWDVELYQNFLPDAQAAPTNATPIDVADWFVVTAPPDVLVDVEAFINLFAASVPQIEIEASVVEVTEADELDYGVQPVGDAPIFEFPGGTFVKGLTYVVPNSVDANEALLQIGAIQDGVVFNAILEAIQSWENVEITTQPRIAVREGGVAEVLNTQDLPFFSFSGIGSAGNFTATLQYKEVGVKLYIAPRVVGTQTLALNLFIEASQQIGSSVSFVTEGGGSLSAPVIAKRQARTVVYLEPGQAIVLGGLVSERTVEVERKVPVLGDIPLLGLLFRSDRTRKERTNVLFFIRPRVLQGADFNRVFPDLRAS